MPPDERGWGAKGGKRFCFERVDWTGKVPFEGETVSDTLACILEREPNWHALPQAVPMNIQVLLRRCLEKDPRRRLRDIGDAMIEINETLSVPAMVPPAITSSAALSRSARLLRWMVWPAVCLLAGAVVTTVIVWNFKRSIPMPLSRLPINLPQNQLLNEQDSEIAVSPDGKRLVYSGNVGATRQLFLRELDQVEGRGLPETKGARLPFFSSEGRSIA